MIAWLVPLVGERLARPVFFAGMAILLILITVIAVKCSGDDGEAQQAEQTVRSGEAIAEAAAAAVDVIDDRRVTEADVAAAADQAAKEIGAAQSTQEIRGAVLKAVCAQASHRNDPACKKDDDR